MSEPTTLRPGFTTGIVSMLTELLRRAQAGEIEQVALVYIEPNGNGYGTWISDRATPGGSTLKLVGAIADLQWTALMSHNEQQGR